MPNEIRIPKKFHVLGTEKEKLTRMVGCRVTAEIDDKLNALAAQSEFTKAKIICTIIAASIDAVKVVDWFGRD